jgi:rhodanese-related sulfurtransferase
MCVDQQAAAGSDPAAASPFVAHPDAGAFALEPIEIEPAAVRAFGTASSGAGWLLLDCRTPEEHATARIAGALLIPMQELSARVDELTAWRNKPVIVHCHHGVRSLRVAHWLRERGFSGARSMRGGIEAWSAEIDPSVPRY